jgi:glutamine phosphoribosylpyrophosphate amidotransferase
MGRRPLAPVIRTPAIPRPLNSPVIFMSPDPENLPVTVAPRKSIHRAGQGIAVLFQGKLTNRPEFIWRTGFEDEGSDCELLGKAMETRLKFQKSFSEVFRCTLAEIRGEFSLIASLGHCVFAARDWDGAGPSLHIGDSFNGVQSISTDTDAMQAFGAEKIMTVRPHQLAWITNGDRKLVPWTFPKSRK